MGVARVNVRRAYSLTAKVAASKYGPSSRVVQSKPYQNRPSSGPAAKWVAVQLRTTAITGSTNTVNQPTTAAKPPSHIVRERLPRRNQPGSQVQRHPCAGGSGRLESGQIAQCLIGDQRPDLHFDWSDEPIAELQGSGQSGNYAGRG